MGETDHRAEVTAKCENTAIGVCLWNSGWQSGLPHSVWEQEAVPEVIQAMFHHPCIELLELNSL